MFKSKGVIVINKEAIGEEELMDLALEAGAEDVRTEGDVYEVLTAPDASFDEVKKAIEAKGITPESAELTKLPDTEVNISDEHTAESLMKMMDELDDHDDTKNVYSNYNIPDDIMAKLDK